MKKRKSGFYYFFHNRNGVIGLCGVLLIVAIGLIGPLLIAKPEGYTTEILLAPSAAHWLGTDSLGLDIFCSAGLGRPHVPVCLHPDSAGGRRHRSASGPDFRLCPQLGQRRH